MLAVLLIVGGGYYFSKNKTADQVTIVPQTQTPNSTTIIVPATGTPALKPAAPLVETGQKTSTSSSTAIVTGQVNPNGALASYWFEYGQTTALGSKTSSQQVGSGYSSISTPAYITGLRANTTYYYRLSASNRFATVNGATYTFQTNSTPPVKVTLPTARTNNATGIDRTTAVLNGQVVPNGSPTSFWFEYGTDNTLGNITSFQTTAANTTQNASASLSGLDPLTKYYFRLNAQNLYGTANGSILSFTTKGPAAPTKPTVDTTGATSVTATTTALNGRINPNGEETTYWFEYSENSSLNGPVSTTSNQTIALGVSTISAQAIISGLDKNTRYYYRLVGKNAEGTTEGDIESFKTAQ